MRRATVRAALVGLALASLVPLSTARAADDDPPARPLQLMSAQAQQPPSPAAPPPFIYGFFRDPLWPGPGQRFIAADCPIGVGAGIIHYCPGLPPLAEPLAPVPPVWPTDIRQCDPWFQYFPTCRRDVMTN